MFHEIPASIQQVMHELEINDRANHSFSMQVPPDVGRLLAILAASAPGANWLELGTSCGYSALWLSLACQLRGTQLISVDHDPKKVDIANSNFRRARVTDTVRVVEGDSIEELKQCNALDFCFIDAYGGRGTYELVVSKMNPGGLFVYDHTKGRGAEIIEAATADPRVDAVLVPLASEDARTELICRRSTG